jgi:hypothetical protein
VEKICQGKWRTGRDRSEAQILLFRLENLLHPEAGGVNPPRRCSGE